jgi:hypothetical protein
MKTIRTKKMVMDKSKYGLGLLFYKIAPLQQRGVRVISPRTGQNFLF